MEPHGDRSMLSASQQPRAIVTGMGSALPDRVVINDEFQAWMETSDAWIRERSGIESRRWVRNGNVEQAPAAWALRLAETAGRRALVSASCSSFDLLICATISPHHEMTGLSLPLALRLCPSDPPETLEVRNHCSGFLFALQAARALIATGRKKRILIVSGEVQSTGLLLRSSGRDTAVLFGDGFGACVLEASTSEQPQGFIDIILSSDGTFSHALGVECPGYRSSPILSSADFEGDKPRAFPRMDGRAIFKLASTKMPEIIRTLLERNAIAPSELRLIIPHQAKKRILQMLEAVLEMLGKVFCNIEKLGNLTGGSLPVAFLEARKTERLKPGDLVCLVAFGAGLAWGAALYRIEEREFLLPDEPYVMRT